MERPTVLLAEPSECARRDLSAKLEERGWRVWSCESPEEACRRAAAGPDVALIAGALVLADDFRLVHLLRMGLGHALPVVVLGCAAIEGAAGEHLAELGVLGPLDPGLDGAGLAQALEGALVARAAADRPRVLLVDRPQGPPSALKGSLSRAGFEAVHAACSELLAGELPAPSPHAVLLRDVPAVLGVGHGPEDFHALAKRVPLFVLAEAPDGHRHARWLEAGAAAYLAEPLDLEDLVERLDPPRGRGLGPAAVSMANGAEPEAGRNGGQGWSGGLGEALARTTGLLWLRLSPKGRVESWSEAASNALGLGLHARSEPVRPVGQRGARGESAGGPPEERIPLLTDLLPRASQASECAGLLARLAAGEGGPHFVAWDLDGEEEEPESPTRRLCAELVRLPLADGEGALVLLGQVEAHAERGFAAPEAAGTRAAWCRDERGEVFWWADGGLDRLHYATPPFETLFGTGVAEAIAVEGFLASRVEEVDRPRLERAIETHRAGSPTEIELRIRGGGGTTRWVRLRAFPVQDARGRLVRTACFARDVTERRLAELTLRESEQRLASVVTSAPIALFSIDRQGYFRLCDGRGLERMGLTPGQVVGRSIFELYREYPQAAHNVRRALSGENFSATIELGIYSFETSYTPVFEENGEVSGVIGVALDVTDRRRAEERLKLIVEATSSVAGQGFFRSLVRYLAGSLGVRTAYVAELVESERLRMRCLWSGKDFSEDFEYDADGSPDALVLQDGTVYYPQGVLQRFERGPELLGSGVQSYLGTPIHDSGGRVVGVLGVLHDAPLDDRLPTEQILRIFAARAGVEIERLGAEEAVRESEARWRSLVENAPDLIATLDREGRVLFANRSLERDRDGQPSPEHHLLIGPERERLAGVIAQVFASGEGHAFEHRLRLPDGGEAWFACRLGALERDGQVQAVVLIATDVTQRKEAEGKLEFRASLEKLLTSISTRFINLDPEDVDQSIQTALRKIGVFCGVDRCYVFQFRTDRQVLENTHEWCAPGVESFVGRVGASAAEDVPRFSALLRRVRAGDNVFVQRVGALGGAERDLAEELNALGVRSLLAVPMTCAGETIGFLGFDTVRWEMAWDEQVVSLLRIVGDVFANTLERKRAEEDRRLLEEQLRQAQKMEAIGTLAGGVAHDFNNLLTGILGYSSLLRVRANGDGEIEQAVRVIETAAERAADLTKQLLGFARRGEAQSVPVRVHGTVEEVIELLRRTIDKRIEMRCEFHADHDVVLADPGQLQQVVLNLAVNARDAMPDGGRMTFASRELEIRPEDALRFPELTPGAYFVLAVEDSGAGIPQELQSRIFEPFFTTKGPGKGSGMGLAMVYGILRQHGGSIRVDSEPGSGARFSLFLPRADVSQVAPGAAPVGAPAVNGQGCILVVDDEAVVRATATELLRYLGYCVLHAEGGREALEIYAARGAEIDLVLLDLMMPDLDGRETLTGLRAQDPEVRVVLSSGYGFEDLIDSLGKESLSGFARKPYQLAELSRIVALALGSDGDAELRDEVLVPRAPSSGAATNSSAAPGPRPSPAPTPQEGVVGRPDEA